MPQISFSVGGQLHTVTAPDSFLKLSEDKQKAALTELASKIQHPGALDGLGQAVQAGAHGVGQGLQATANLASQDVGQGSLAGKALHAVGNAIGDLTPNAPQNYTGSGFEQDFNAGHYGAAASDVPRLIAQSAPDLAGNVAAGALAGPGGLVGYNVARNLGQNAQARAQANGDATPTTADQLVGGASAVGQGLLQTVGLGKVPITKGLLDAVPGLLKPVANAAGEGVAGAGANVLQQAANTAGTKQGLTVDPTQALESGIGAAGARGVQTLGGQAVAAKVNALRNAATGDINDLSPEKQDSYVRVTKRMQDLQPANGGQADPVRVMNSIKAEVTPSTEFALRKMRDAGLITTEQYNTIAKPLVQSASTHNHELMASVGDAAGTVLDRLGELNLPPDAAKALRSTALDLQTLSEGARFNRQTGPTQRIMEKLGAVGSIAASPFLGGHDHLLDLALGGAMSNKTSKTFGKAGSLVDRALGLQEPKAVLQARAIMAARAKAGQDAGPSLTDNLATLHAFADNPSSPEAQQEAAQQATREAMDKAWRQRQAGFLRSKILQHGPDDSGPGAVAMQQLHDLMGPDLANTVRQEWDARQPVNNAEAQTAQAAASNRQSVKDEQAIQQRNAAAGRADAEAAFSPTPEQNGQQAAQRQLQALLAKHGPDHPAGKVAAETLQESNPAMLAQALAQFRAMQPVRDAQPDIVAANAAQKHQLNLNAAETDPNAPNVGIDAINAASNELQNRATDTMRLARGEGPAGVPPRAAQAPSGQPAAPSPGNGPLAPQGEHMPVTDATLPTGWMKYVLDGLRAHGVQAHPDHALQAVSDLLAANHPALPQDIGQMLPDYAGPVYDQRMLAHIQAQTAKRAGQEDKLMQALSQGAPRGSSKPQTDVRDEVKYRVGADKRQATYSKSVAELRAKGLKDAAQTIQNVRHESAQVRKETFDDLPEKDRHAVYRALGKTLYGGDPKQD